MAQRATSLGPKQSLFVFFGFFLFLFCFCLVFVSFCFFMCLFEGLKAGEVSRRATSLGPKPSLFVFFCFFFPFPFFVFNRRTLFFPIKRAFVVYFSVSPFLSP